MVLVGGERLAARFAGIEHGQLRWESEPGNQRYHLEDVVHWGWPSENRLGHRVLLTDGGVLLGELLAVRPTEVQLATRYFGPIRLPRGMVAGIVIRGPTEVLDDDRMESRLREGSRDLDIVVLANGDELQGSVRTAEASQPDSPPVAIHVGSNASITDLEAVAAMAFSRPPKARPESQSASLWVGLQDGTTVRVNLPLPTKPQGELTLSGGVKLSASEDPVWQQVTFLQPQTDRFVYVSDLPLAGYKHIPFLTQAWPLGMNESALGCKLRHSGRIYLKGLGMHTASRAAFNLGRQFRWLESELVVQEADRGCPNGSGAVTFRVFLDAAPASRPPEWKLGYESSLVRGGDAPLPMRVDVHGAERLALVVDFAERGDEGDAANWLNARLIP